ncbi:ATP-binding protein [Streptomyces sp. TS71-3]|uniref:ATP-binding protein n=1 Tax=Streptomyces sp. TS71-3 TaxID=2733862 RepID=UPI001BB3EC2A|nr:ATP-binding protein [Streptomyces sp. TS71-3]
MTQPFEDLVRDRTGPDFVERRWLRERIERALAGDAGYVLVTGEPGAGKTSMLASLARSRPDRLRYFVRRDSRTALAGGDVQSFLLSIGHQLARHRPELFRQDRLEVVVRQHIDTVEAGGRAVGIRIADLTASPFHRTATLALEQRVTHVVSGSVSGIEIGTATLEPRLLEPDNLAHLALIDPAEVLLAEDPDARIVILLDALDELAGRHADLLDWLVRGPELPRNVRLVLTSRPHPALEPLRLSRAHRLHEVAIDPGSPQVHDDLAGYAEHVLGTEAVTRAARCRGHDPRTLRRDAVRRAAGNFLHLAAYARALTDAATADDGVLLPKLLALNDLPPGLGGLYAFFVATARTDIENLGMLEIRDPAGAAGRTAPAWETVGQPLLGVLTVARDPLTVEELTALAGIRVWPRAVRNVLARLRWLLDVRGERLAFYHASIGEFLAGERTAREHPDYAVDTQEWHERIVRHYRGAAASWAEVDWPAVDRYGLTHLAEHTIRCRPAVADGAVHLVCGGLRRAIRADLGSDRHFLRLLDLVGERVVNRFPPATGIPAVLYLGVVRRQVLRGMRTLAPAVLGLLVRLGRTEEALEHLSAQPPSLQQFEAAVEIVNRSRPLRTELLDLLVETALTVPADEARDGDPTAPSRHPLKRAARVLAPHDLPRALRLWERASATGRSEAPDPVYRAAAEATGDLEAARALVASIRTDRAGAYLDLAARAEPGDLPDLLRLAEDALSGAALTDELRTRAGLAAAWAAVDADRAAGHLAALLTAVDREAPDAAERTEGIVEAASRLAEHDRTTARALLDRLDAIEVDGLVDDAFLRAATLWARFGALDRARALLDRLVAWNDTVWTRIRVSKVVARFDRSEAQRMVERAHAMIRPADPGGGTVSYSFRESELRTVALELAGYDPQRAVAAAGEMANVGWSEFLPDRYSTLARIAHALLDRGDSDTPRTILAGIHRSAEQAPPLVDRRLGPYYPLTGASPPRGPGSPAERAEHLPFLYNHTRDWQFLSERRFHHDPADLIRAMAPGSWSSGNPYSLARTVRVLAETVVDREPRLASALVHSLTDGGERAIGTAALFRSAAETGAAERAGRLWAEVGRALSGIPSYAWTVDDQDGFAFAYVRPDHRALFEAAIRLIPHEADTGLHLLGDAGLGYLQHAFQLSFVTFASAAYAGSVLSGRAPYPTFQRVHEDVISRPAVPEGHPDTALDIARAAVAFHESLIAPRRGRAAEMVIKDPVYAAAVDLVTAGEGEPISGAFAEKVRALASGDRLPAAAGLVEFAARLRPVDDRVRRLAGEIVDASEGRGAQRVVTLLQFACSPVLGELVDPVELLAEAERLPDDPFSRVEQDEAVTRLFPVLLGLRPPAVALRLLHDSVLENWSRAMALLECAAEPLVTALGTDVAGRLTEAVRAALACVSPDGTAPDEVDGVRLGHGA